GRPRGGERPRIEDTASEELLGGDAFGLGLREVGSQVSRHLLGKRVGHAQAPPLPAALLDEITHEVTSTLTGRAPRRRRRGRLAIGHTHRERQAPRTRRASPRRLWRGRRRVAAWSSRSRMPASPPSLRAGKDRAHRGRALYVAESQVPCTARY